MLERGELKVYGAGETVDTEAFVMDVLGELAPYRIGGIGADRYKIKRVTDALAACGYPPGMVEWRGVGKGAERQRRYKRLPGRRSRAPDSLQAEQVYADGFGAQSLVI